jgi:predicted nucleotide-binding protein with TIR-like domain
LSRIFGIATCVSHTNPSDLAATNCLAHGLARPHPQHLQLGFEKAVGEQSARLERLARTELKPRALQNVIGELFWFTGKLGRDRVCALKKGNLEMPSDFAVSYIPNWTPEGLGKAELLRELRASGYQVDCGKALA